MGLHVAFCQAQQGDSLMVMISRTIAKMAFQFPADIARYWCSPHACRSMTKKLWRIRARTRIWSRLLYKSIMFSPVINLSVRS